LTPPGQKLDTPPKPYPSTSTDLAKESLSQYPVQTPLKMSAAASLNETCREIATDLHDVLEYLGSNGIDGGYPQHSARTDYTGTNDDALWAKTVMRRIADLVEDGGASRWLFTWDVHYAEDDKIITVSFELTERDNTLWCAADLLNEYLTEDDEVRASGTTANA